MRAFYRLLIAATLTGVLIPAAGVMTTTGQLVTAGAIILVWLWAMVRVRREAVDNFADALGEAVRQKRGAR